MVNELTKSLIRYRKTRQSDLDYVLEAESHPDNSPYVFQWERAQHIDSLSNSDMLHLIFEDREGKPVGYTIIAGLTNSNKSIELKRLVITEKGRGYGRAALLLIKNLTFHSYKAHRLWLDVVQYNSRARYLYKSVGFVEEGLLRECDFYKGKYESIYIMSILESEYFNRAE